MFNHEVSKHDPRVDAYGAVDEFSAALGMLRANPSTTDSLSQRVLSIQKHLIGLMGEILRRLSQWRSMTKLDTVESSRKTSKR